jgi:histone acetyltransferase MYST1
VHYFGFNKRLDAWVTEDKISILPPDTEEKKNSILTRYHKRQREDLHSDYEDQENPNLAQFEKEHEENTKVRNVDRIVLGRYEIQPWYYSPYLYKYPQISTLYVCEFCLKYMRHGSTYKQHMKKCIYTKPLGKLIYRDKVEIPKVKTISVYEIMGAEHKLYCQNFCLLAKLFLDHKTLHYYVPPFKFYVLTEDSGKFSRIVGYFSKEIGNDEYNLACILVLPPYQQKGYGRFLIALSYELSKRDKKIGTPERPLSDMGRISYKSYWTDTILQLIRERGNLSLKEITETTGIAPNDVMETLSSFNMVKYWKGQYIISIANNKVIEEHFKKKEAKKKDTSVFQVKLNPYRLNYTKSA